MKQRFFRHGVKRMVELFVVLRLQLRGLTRPDWGHIVHDVGFIGFHLLTILPRSLFPKGNGHRHEAAILLQ